MVESPEGPRSFTLPDLASHCVYSLKCHPGIFEIPHETLEWLKSNCLDLTEEQRAALEGLKAGELTCYCYNAASKEKVRVVADFLAYLFHLDNISDGMLTTQTNVLADVVMNALWFPEKYKPTATIRPAEIGGKEPNPGVLARDFFGRCITDAGPGCQARFKETFELFFEAVNIQAKARDAGKLLDLEYYINVRRDTSGCKPCWALIEYAMGIDLPDEVIENEMIAALGQHTNDLVTWSNDIFSYRVEHARGDNHNMIDILMISGLTLQQAVDNVGQRCKDSINAFSEKRKLVPSWGPTIDDMVHKYVQGLQDWIVGSLHWSFITERYFGKDGKNVKETGIVELTPPI